MPPPLRLIFLGSDAIALPVLDWLASEGSAAARLIAIYTQPDRPAGRGQKIEPGPIKRWALAHNVPVRQPAKMTPEEQAGLAALEADVALVMAYGHILAEDVIRTPRLGTLNLHASILPKYRGASPIQTAVACGERETGVTLMRVVRQLDAGPVADVERVAIGQLDTVVEVESRLAAACVPLLARSLPRLAEGTLSFQEQDHAAASFCRRLVKEDGQLDFAAPAAVLAARINGLFPWPGCAVEISGQSVRMGLADAAAAVENTGHKAATPGSVMGADAEGLLVSTGAGVLRLRRLQRPGGKMLPTPEFLHGFAVTAETRLPSRPMNRLVDTRPVR